MLLTFVFVFFLCVQDRIAEKCYLTVDDTELMMAFLVHRHGDRAAEQEEISLSENPVELYNRSAHNGFGHLTDTGRVRSYVLGQFLRRRYNKFLSSSFNSSDMFVRSTGTNRTQMTAQIAFTAAYSSRELWSDDMDLVPLEMAVTPYNVDPNESIENCPELKAFFAGMASQDKFPKDMQMYDELMEKLSKKMQVSLNKNPWILYLKLMVFTSEESVGMHLSDFDRRLMPTLRQAAIKASNHIYGKQEYIPLEAGVLLKDFFDAADQIIAGANIPRLRVLSAHEFNVFAFEAAARAVPRQGAPRYCSVFALELRRCSCGRYFVLPVYLKTPEEPEAYLEIEECGVLCKYETFRNLTAKNVMTRDQYKKRCLMNVPESLVDADDVLL